MNETDKNIDGALMQDVPQNVVSGSGDDAPLKSSEEKPAEAAAPVKKGRVRTTRKKKQTIKHVPQGNVYIQATYNNTIITVTDPHGNVIDWSSAGRMGFRGPKKATPYAASVTVRDVSERLKLMGFKEASVFVRGIGSGRDGAIRSLNANGINVIAIKDVTPIPHNGCRARRPRRI